MDRQLTLKRKFKGENGGHLDASTKRPHRKQQLQQSRSFGQQRFLFEVPDGDLTIILGKSKAGQQQSPQIRVYSQVMANASDVWKQELKTAAVLADGKMFFAMAEDDVETFVRVCRLVHFYGSISKPPLFVMRRIAMLSIEHGCWRAIQGFMFLWFNLYLMQDDLNLSGEWALLLVALECHSQEMFYTISGRILSTEPQVYEKTNSFKTFDMYMSEMLLDALIQNKNLLENTPTKPESVGICLRCFNKIRCQNGRKNFLSHMNFAKCS